LSESGGDRRGAVPPQTHFTNDLAATPLGDPVYLYTGELHSRYRYIDEQLTQQIMADRILYEEEASALFIIRQPGPAVLK